MRVLIVADDLYSKIGGGQTFYRQLIASHPDITFVYFRRTEAEDAPRPANTHTFAIRPRRRISVSSPIFFPASHRDSLADALAYAEAVRGQRFDITDLPDFLTFGAFFRQAVSSFGGDAGAIVLSMHGSISYSLRHDWDGDAGTIDLQDLEARQFAAADGRYAISPTYAREWRERIDLPVTVLDPRSILPPIQHRPETAPPKPPPDLLLVGRRERRKGDDIALDLISWIDPNLFGRVILIGEDVPTKRDDSAAILRTAASQRAIDVEFLPAKTFEELTMLFQQNVALICATRQDSLNLVVLEAAASGCPVAVSSRAGAVEILQSLADPPPVLVFDIDARDQAILSISDWLSRYEPVSEAAKRAARNFMTPPPILDVRPVYDAAMRAPHKVAGQLQWRSHALAGVALVRPLSTGAAKMRAQLHASGLGGPARTFVRTIRRARNVSRHAVQRVLKSETSTMITQANELPERTETQIETKIALLSSACSNSPLRVNFWLEAARLERLRGRDLVAAAYELRGFRLARPGTQRSSNMTARTLVAEGLAHVGEVLQHGFGSEGSNTRLSEFLNDRSVRLKTRPEIPAHSLAQQVDFRKGSEPKVSVVLSIYEAARELPLFLSLLQRQSFPLERLELIIVDANSTDAPLAVIEANAGRLAANILYLRTRERETIQAAWNRALLSARGEYVAFLGVDETLFPRALERLAARLDDDISLDWVVGSSLVTDVNAAGGHLFDKMYYDRRAASRDLALMDTTYVSWVGGLYRKNLHQRVGWYDPAFRAAGDTEFKMRVIGKLNVGFIDETLGLFLDYPAQRASASPVAEVEDTLAWYVHRTTAGAAVLARDRSGDQLWELLRACASYRKCFRTHRSTDIDFAASIATHLASDGETRAVQLANDFRAMQSALQSREHGERATDIGKISAAEGRIRSLFQAQRARHQQLLSLAEPPPYDILNDNRFEQHNWYW